jgi:hypothetical protein
MLFKTILEKFWRIILKEFQRNILKKFQTNTYTRCVQKCPLKTLLYYLLTMLKFPGKGFLNQCIEQCNDILYKYRYFWYSSYHTLDDESEEALRNFDRDAFLAGLQKIVEIDKEYILATFQEFFYLSVSLFLKFGQISIPYVEDLDNIAERIGLTSTKLNDIEEHQNQLWNQFIEALETTFPLLYAYKECHQYICKTTESSDFIFLYQDPPNFSQCYKRCPEHLDTILDDLKTNHFYTLKESLHYRMKLEIFLVAARIMRKCNAIDMDRFFMETKTVKRILKKFRQSECEQYLACAEELFQLDIPEDVITYCILPYLDIVYIEGCNEDSRDSDSEDSADESG